MKTVSIIQEPKFLYRLAKIENNRLFSSSIVNDNNHPNYSKMVLLLCIIIPGTTWDVHLQHTTRL